MFGHANEGFVESPLGALIVSVAEESIGIHRRTQLCGNAHSIRLVSAGIGLTRSRIILAAYAVEIITTRDEIGRLGLLIDRKHVVEGKRVSVGVFIGGRRNIKKKK